MSELLLVAALEQEVRELDGVRAICCGIGPVEAALATAGSLVRERACAVLNVGTAGAAELEPGTLVVGSQSVYTDVLDPNATAPRVAHITPSRDLHDAVSRALPQAIAAPIATAGRVGGGAGYDVEAMEGFGVIRAAQTLGVPAVELRVISNSPAQTDRRRWRVDEALAVLHDAIAIAVPAILRTVC